MSTGPDPRGIDLEVTVAGTPEQVWLAIATGPGVTAWLQPTEVQPYEGGRFAFDMGDGMNESGRVTAWAPPHRFATGGVCWTAGGETVALATEWSIEAVSGGSCVVRMVMSGFGTGAAWDAEIDGLTEGMRLALAALRVYLSHIHRQE